MRKSPPLPFPTAGMLISVKRSGLSMCVHRGQRSDSVSGPRSKVALEVNNCTQSSVTMGFIQVSLQHTPAANREEKTLVIVYHSD